MRFWVVYDYGQGGVWAVIEAQRTESIVEQFPELRVVDGRPDWMTDEQAVRLEANALDLRRPSGLLADILSQRK